MPTSAVNSHGTLLKRGDGGSPTETFTTIAEVLDISGPALALGTEDATSHDSNYWREFIPTIKEGGEVSCDIQYYSHTTHDNLVSDFNNRVKRNFQLVFPIGAGETWSFAAIVSGISFNAPVEGKLTASLTLTITGAVTVS